MTTASPLLTEQPFVPDVPGVRPADHPPSTARSSSCADGDALHELRAFLCQPRLAAMIEDAPPTPFLGGVCQPVILSLLDLLAEVHADDARSVARPYISRALATRQLIREAEECPEGPITPRYHVEDVVLCVVWAYYATLAVRGHLPIEAFRRAQAEDEDFGVMLAISNGTPPADAPHPETFHRRADGRFRWEGWARAVCRRDYLSRAAKQIAPLLAWYADRDGECFPSQRELSLDSGMTARSVKDAVRELERDLALQVVEQHVGRRRKTYRLLPVQAPPLARPQYADTVPF